jgi:hypothetical protein
MSGLLTTALTPRWRQYAIGSALAFLTIGAVLVWLAHPEILEPSTKRWSSSATWVRSHPGVGPWVLGLSLSALTVALAAAAQFTAPPLLGLLAGSGWPDLRLVRWWAARSRSRHLKRWRAIRERFVSTPDDAEHRARRAADSARLRRYPASARTPALPDVAPTRLGNVLKAMHERIAARHGLRLEACWHPMLAVIPEDVRAVLEDRSAVLLLRTQQLLLSAAGVTWTGLAWASAPAARLSPIFAAAYLALAGVWLRLVMHRLTACLEEYCDLVEAVVTTHRGTLYRAVGRKPPADAAAEPADGAALNAYLVGRHEGSYPFSWS